MKLVLPTPLRPADDIATMLRALADEIEQASDVLNVIVVIERDDAEEAADVRGFGPCDDPYRAAGILSKAVRDVLP
ncbi:hypothetical protein MOP88_07365 [Sphingomonas sp. WKB10]|nr:hypothetical protein [Sphingomonas sp. WKB10]